MHAIILRHPQIGPCWFVFETETDESNCLKDFQKIYFHLKSDHGDAE